MDLVLLSLAVLGGTGILAAIVLYVVAKRFYVYEDPRIAQVEAVLPGANCGACGKSGCHDFATACVKAGSLEGLVCPGAGDEGMARIAEILGVTRGGGAAERVAVLRCNGTCDVRPTVARYDGAQSCALLATLATGTSACAYGCLGCGDCVNACPWDAMHLDTTTGLPVIDDEKCIGCGMCVAACPRKVIELRAKGPRGMRVWVACNNKDRGAVAMKACKVACIGCSKCKKECTHDAISINNNLSYIDYTRCKLCKKCVDVCPTHAIQAVNFPQKKQSL